MLNYIKKTLFIFSSLFILADQSLAYEYSPYRCYYKAPLVANPNEEICGKATLAKQKDKEKFNKQCKETYIYNLNNFVETRIKNTIKKLNEKESEGCLEGTLLTHLKQQLDSGTIVGETEHYAWKDLPGEKCDPEIEKSIYNNSTGIVPNLLSTVSTGAGLQPTIRICEINIGVDKFGHFMGFGLKYLNKFKKSGYPKAFEAGNKSEEGFYGMTTTGVKSYGDLAANLSGMHFWKNLYEENDKNKRAYVKCEKGKYVWAGRDFTWCNHINRAWDEANNCSVFRDNLKKGIAKNMDSMTDEEKPKNGRFICPMELQKCQAAIDDIKKLLGPKDYQKYKANVIGPDCLALDQNPQQTQPEQLSSKGNR